MRVCRAGSFWPFGTMRLALQSPQGGVGALPSKMVPLLLKPQAALDFAREGDVLVITKIDIAWPDR